MVEITDSHILMYLDGVADPDIKKTIEGQRDYQIRAQELGQLQQDFLGNFYRMTCPDSLSLGEYLLGLLPQDERRIVESHVHECPHCTSELREMEVFNQHSFRERVIAWLISGGESRHQPGWVPANGTRGGMGGPLVYETGEVQIAVDIQEDGDHPGYQSIIGFISGAQAEAFEVSLWREEVQLTTAQVDELNYFTIDHLSRGDYELLIRGPKVEIQIQKLTL